MEWIRRKWQIIELHREEAVLKKRVFSMYCLLPNFDYDDLSKYSYDLGYGKNHYAAMIRVGKEELLTTKIIENTHQLSLEDLHF